MKVLFISSELSPFIKVGGLADVAGSLPKSLKKLGADVSVVIPFYECLQYKKKIKSTKKTLSVNFKGKKEFFSLFKTYIPKSKVPVFLIKNKKYFGGNSVYPEEDASSGGSMAEAERFLFFSVASLKVAKLLKPEIVHCQDWHVSIVPYLIKKDFKTLLTIHNLGYQGIYNKNTVNNLLGTNFKTKEINCLKLGISKADYLNTVSKNYAKEILTKEYGFGLEKELKERKKELYGIINGLDENIFNPSKDKYIKAKYSLSSLAKKQRNKKYLQKKFFKKTDINTPLIGMVSRIADQKGFNLLEIILPLLIKCNLNLIILGKGSKNYEKLLKEKSNQHPDKLGVKIGFDEKLAHQIYAGSDMFLMPSFFEPCGLGQLIAMKYGTIPIVRSTGGLKDTVTPIKIEGKKISGTGFLFKDYKGESFWRAILRSLVLFKEKSIWKKIQRNGMKQDFSWRRSAKEYLKLYRKMLK